MSFAGRGRGRGRGRGASAGPRPVAKDDDGKVLQPEQSEGPPPLYPHVDLPPQVTDIDDELRELMADRGEFENDMKASAFYLKPPEMGGRGGSQLAADAAWCSAALREMGRVATFDPEYFPPELLGTQARSGGAARVDTEALRSRTAPRAPLALPDRHLSRLSELESKERQAGAAARAGDAISAAEEGEAGPEDFPDAEADEDFEDYGQEAYDNIYDDDDDGNYEDEPFGRDEGPVM